METLSEKGERSSELWLEWHKGAIWHRKNNRNNSTSTASTAVLALLSPFIQRLRLYPATRILIHSLIISCLDYCNNVCAKLLFFFNPHTTRLFRASLLALFLTAVSLLFAYVFPHCYSPISVPLHMKSRLEVQCITAIIQEPQGNSRLQPSVYSPVHLLSLYHSCYPNTPSFFCMFKIQAYHMFLCLKSLKFFILFPISMLRNQLNWPLFAALQHTFSFMKQCTGCHPRGFLQMSQCSHWKKMQQKAQHI